MHPRNKHQGQYDFEALKAAKPELVEFLYLNKYGKESLDFSNPTAVKVLNQALLKEQYGIDFWDFPEPFLCPPIPGRADYIHHLADLLATENSGKVPTGKEIKCLDIGTGANCIYPILGNRAYRWSFLGVDVEEESLIAAGNIVDFNDSLKGEIQLRKQENKHNVFHGIIERGEFFHASICNPPFHDSAESARKANARKRKGLSKESKNKSERNFSGAAHELWCKGGEKQFLRTMIQESKGYSKNVMWFTSLVSKASSLEAVENYWKMVKVAESRVIEMKRGNKKTRIIAWKF